MRTSWNGPYTQQTPLGTVYPERMSEGPVVNYTADAVSGFGDPLPGGMPVVPDLNPEPPPDPEPEPEPAPEE